jgi:hypothetical protein
LFSMIESWCLTFWAFCFCFAVIPCVWCILALKCGLVSTFQMDLGYSMRCPIGGPASSSIDETIYPCGTCDQPVTWENRCIVCDTCNQWYHVSCQSMSSNTYLEHANDSAVVWDCIMCNCPNFSTVYDDQWIWIGHGVYPSPC